jgi:DNA polymerase-3 subunit delta'
MTADLADPRDVPFHPRRRTSLQGHERQEARLLHAYASGRMHHAWLLAGPRGIGKATLAYRLARFVLQFPEPHTAVDRSSLFVPADAPAARRIASRGHADLLIIERAWDEKNKLLRTEISAEGARAASDFFSRTAGEGGWRVCIVDAADDLNSESANAILKTLEEPPPRSLFVLVSHQPGRLLPTIRSRCIRLDLHCLSFEQTYKILDEIGADAKSEELQLAAKLSRGSPGRALDLAGSVGATSFASFMEAASRGKGLNTAIRLRIADAFGGRGTARDFDIFYELLQEWMARQARHAALQGNRSGLAKAHDQVAHSLRLTNALNLDRRQAVLDALDAIETAMRAAQTSA